MPLALVLVACWSAWARTPTAGEDAAAVHRLIGLGRPVYCGGHKPYAALTFDDGPGPYTHLALNILHHFHVPATFFLVGRSIESFPSLVRRDGGAGALGDHTWTHPNLTALSRPAVARQLRLTQQAIERRSHKPVVLFRPPYGAYDDTVTAVARRLGMLEILWNVDSGDSLGADYKGIARNVRAGLHAGSIILMHDNRGQTIRALRYLILPHARHVRLRLVTVPQLMALNPPSARQLRRGLGGCHLAGAKGSGG